MFIMDTRPKGVKKEDIAKEWGVGKNEYARLKKKLAESGTLATKAKSGRPLKLSREDYLKLEKLNTKVRRFDVRGTRAKAIESSRLQGERYHRLPGGEAQRLARRREVHPSVARG